MSRRAARGPPAPRRAAMTRTAVTARAPRRGRAASMPRAVTRCVLPVPMGPASSTWSPRSIQSPRAGSAICAASMPSIVISSLPTSWSSSVVSMRRSSSRSRRRPMAMSSQAYRTWRRYSSPWWRPTEVLAALTSWPASSPRHCPAVVDELGERPSGQRERRCCRVLGQHACRELGREILHVPGELGKPRSTSLCRRRVASPMSCTMRSRRRTSSRSSWVVLSCVQPHAAASRSRGQHTSGRVGEPATGRGHGSGSMSTASRHAPQR